MTVVWGAYGLGGHMTRRLLPAIQRGRGGKLVAVGHYRLDKAKSVAEEFRIPKHYDSLEKLLEDDEVTAVAIATPNYLHYEHGKAVLEAGKHLFLEKPMTLKAEHAQEIVEISQKKRLTVGVGFHLRHHVILKEMHRRIKAGEVGEPLYIHATFGRAHPWQDGSWWADAQKAGPQVLTGYGVHLLDLCRWLLDAEISSLIADLLWEPQNTFAVFRLRMSNKTQCSLMCSSVIEHIPNTIEVMGREGRLVGAGAVTTTDAGKLLRSLENRVEMIEIPPSDPYLNEIENFNKSLAEGKEFRANAIDGLKVVQAQQAIVKSSEEGCIVSAEGGQ